jgi:RimJ/RimL family protein N-acetyltransferase
MNAIPFLKGRQVYLRPLAESDRGGAYPHWLNDKEVCQGNSHHLFPYTLEAASDYITNANRGRQHLVLAIVSLADGLHIGNIALDNIDYISRSAVLSILIGEKSCWGKGYGKEAAELICSHGFMALNLHRIACGTFENNQGMLRLATHLGMQEEGRRRQAIYKRGRYLDVIEYGVLKGEYIERFKLQCS